MIELTRASFQYENSDRGVQDISLSVKGGECVVLTGLSGCGKTTVTRLVNGLAPSYYPGVFSGSVRIDGKDISRLSTWEIGRLVGSVFQDPKSQFFSSELAGEVAFPCENYGLSAREIRARTDAAIETLKLSHLKDRAVDVLSSGEKQRAAIASVYAMKPKVFVCDEPTANLDAAGTRQLAQTLRQLKEQGFTLLLAEHRIDWLMGIADRFLYLRDGRIAAEYTPKDLLLLPEADILGMGLRSPHEEKILPAPSVLDESPAVLKTAGLSKRIRKEVIFEDISLSVPKGGVTAITGQNGAGKTTLAQILCGLAKQTRGHILIDGKKARAAARRREIYYCGNDTSTQFFTASVAEELLLNTELTEENKDRARHLLKELGLYEYRDAHPSALSGGQKQRLAIACAIFSGRRILILDEPTSGLDGQNMRLIAERLKSEAQHGRTILVITHDRELIESCCDDIVEVEKRSSWNRQGTLWDIHAERIVFRPCRQLDRDGRALVRAFLHPNGAAVESGDLPHQREPQPHTAVFAAAGLVHPEEGLEDTALILLRDAAAGVGNANDALFLPLCKLDPHRAAWAVVFDGVLRQVKEQTVDQRVAASQGAVALRFQRDASLLRQRRKVCEDFLNHWDKLNLLVPRHLLQIAHLQQRLGHLRQPLRLLAQKREELRRLRPHIGMLCGKQLQLRLHQRQRRAQLVGGVAGELPLGGKGVVQPLQHLVEGVTELPEFRQHILIDPHIRQIVQLHLLHLRGKAAQGIEGVSADEIGQNTAEQRYRRRDVPIGGAEAPLRPIDDDGQLLAGSDELRIKARRSAIIQDHRAAL